MISKRLLALFDVCNDSLAANPKAPWLRKWRVMACRDGAMSIYHFGEAMAGIRATLRIYPVL
jgi:hypothetical protein